MKKISALPVVLMIVVVISLAFSFFSISSVRSLSQALTTMTESPYSLSGSIYRIKNYVSEGHVRISRLLMYNAADDIELVRSKVGALQSSIRKELEDEAAGVMGNDAALYDLRQDCEQMFVLQDYFLSHVHSYSVSEIESYIDGELIPVYDQVYSDADNILLNIENSITAIIDRSSNTLSSSLIIAVVMPIGIALLSFFLLLLSNIRSKEANKQKYLFDILGSKIDDVFMIYDIEVSQFEHVFSNSERVLGISESQIKKDRLAVFECCSGEAIDRIILQFMNHSIPIKIETEIQFTNPKTAEDKWLLLTIYPVKFSKGSMYIISFADLSEAKKTRDILSDALLNAQKANSAKSDFLSRMSHEIRTPINAIVGMTTIAASSLNNPVRVEDCLTKISDSSKHLLMLINDVLDMSKIESGKLSIVHEAFNLPDLLRNLTAGLTSQVKEKNHGLELLIPSLINEELLGDPLRLNQILLNILSNAIKYTPEGGDIKFEVKELIDRKTNGLRLRFTVSDTGIGMTPEFLERIFTPFEQEYRGKLRTGSTGIGMAIVKNLVSLMGGTISVASKMNAGSTFVVELPFDVTPDSPTPVIIPGFKDLRVLIVDDDDITCEHTSIILGRIGIRGEWCLSGNTALEKIRAAHDEGDGYDVTFIDWKMPVMDGLELTRRIRAELGSDVLIIIISAYDWSEIEEDATEAGVNGFIAKPMCKSSIYNTLVTAVNDMSANVSGSRPVITQMRHGIELNQVGADLSGKRFLLAEDNEINMEIVIEFISQANGEYDTAVNGQEAYDKFVQSETGYYDMILMDIQMPVLNGYEATHAIRKAHRLDANTVKIVALTANAFTEDVLMADQSGMNGHIPKPIDVKVFYDTITRLL